MFNSIVAKKVSCDLYFQNLATMKCTTSDITVFATTAHLYLFMKSQPVQCFLEPVEQLQDAA